MADKFRVHIVRTGTGHNVFKVEAESQEEAGDIAMKLAKSFQFKELDAELTVIDITKE